MDINEKIEEARDFFEIEKYPGNFFEKITNVSNYIDKFGILIFKQDIGKSSGFIGYSSVDVPIICINYKRPIGHQNFTLAHEIGHYYLHHGVSVCDGSNEINGINNEKIEKEAHHFAAELIYPKEYVEKDLIYINQNSLFRVSNSEKLGAYINELCKKYCISFSFALYRLLIINNWPYSRKQKVDSVKRKVGKLSEVYEDYHHIVVEGHQYYQPYNYALNVMKDYINKLIEEEEIGQETGLAILFRNGGL